MTSKYTDSINSRFGSNSVVLICSPEKMCQGKLPPRSAHTCSSTKLSAHSKTTSAAAVLNVSHKPHRYAAAVSTKTKNRKNGLLGPSANTEMKAGHTTSAACTRMRNDEVDSLLPARAAASAPEFHAPGRRQTDRRPRWNGPAASGPCESPPKPKPPEIHVRSPATALSAEPRWGRRMPVVDQKNVD